MKITLNYGQLKNKNRKKKNRNKHKQTNRKPLKLKKMQRIPLDRKNVG